MPTLVKKTEITELTPVCGICGNEKKLLLETTAKKNLRIWVCATKPKKGMPCDGGVWRIFVKNATDKM